MRSSSEPAPIAFGLSGWCRLFAHACTIYTCGCPCHEHNPPRPSTVLHRPIHSGESAS